MTLAIYAPSRRNLLGFFASVACLPASNAQDAAWPTKPVRMVVPAPAGGPSDIVARLIAARLAEPLKQTVLVENRPGASQMLGTNLVAKAEPDGHTLLFITSTPIVMAPNTLKNVPYDVQRELMTVSHVGSTPLVVYVNASRPITNLKQLLEAARAHPVGASYGTSGIGSSTHLLPEMLVKQSGVAMTHVPYKGVAPNLQDLAGNQLLVSVADIGSAIPLVTAGKIRPIAVTGATRAAALPEVATFGEQGYSGMEPFSPWFGLFAPRQTPRAIVDRLSAEVARIVHEPAVRARLVTFGIDPTGLLSPQADEFTRTDMARWKRIVDDLPGIRYE